MNLGIFLCIFFISVTLPIRTVSCANLFDIPDDKEIPDIIQLEKDFRNENSNYRWKYDFSWLRPVSFDTDFRNSIKRFGTVEKHLGSVQEDNLYSMVKRLPKAYYPYIGPELHNIPGLSGKILDMPGIKETKHQFPKRIASRFKDIPNLEFLSPSLYIYLMPELWGEGWNTLEKPLGEETQSHTVSAPNIIRQENIKEVLALVPFSSFNDKPKEKNKGVRHFTADSSTPLSSADVEAFLSTLDGIKEFSSAHKNKLQMIMFDRLIFYWDKKHDGTDEQISLYRGMVNPCQAAVRRIKWAGKRGELQNIIGAEGFGLDDWAQTCDKTLKAYRKGNLTNAHVATINIMKSGAIYDIMYKNKDIYYTKEERKAQKNFIDATLLLFSAPLNDVITVLPYQKQLKKHLREFGSDFLGSPLILP